jgi:hypothetical protein
VAIIAAVAGRADLEALVAELSGRYSGREFVSAVERLADGLEAPDRALLEQVLLERSTDSFRDAIAERVESPGWLRRQLAKIESPRPPRG